MYTDANLIFSDAQAQTTATSHNSTYCIDLQVANPNLGGGTPLWLVVTVNTAFTCTLTCADFQVKLYGSDNGTTWTIILQSDAYDYGECKLGRDLMNVPLPAIHGRYLKLKYVITNAVLTAGKWDAYLSLNPPNPKLSTRG